MRPLLDDYLHAATAMLAALIVEGAPSEATHFWREAVAFYETELEKQNREPHSR